MWVRKCDLDAQAEDVGPIPSVNCSNEEFFPPPPTAEQKEYEPAFRPWPRRTPKGRASRGATSSAPVPAWPRRFSR